MKMMFVLAITSLAMLISVFGANSDVQGLADSSTIVFVDVNNPTCDDAYPRSTALSGSTPWCNLYGNEQKISSGDTVYLFDGEYNTNGNSIVFNQSFASTVNIKAYPENSQINFSMYYPNYLNTGSGLWTENESSINAWVTDANVDNDGECRVAYTNHTPLLPYGSYADFSTTTDRDYPEGVYCDGNNNKIYIRFNSGADPNTVPLFVSSGTQDLFALSGNRMSIQNLTLIHPLTCFDLNNADNTELSGLMVHGHGKRCVNVRAGTDNSVVKHSVFDYYFNTAHSWDAIKNQGNYAEATPWQLSYAVGNNNAFANNTVRNVYNGPFPESNTNSQNLGTLIEHNNIYNIFDDGIEWEQYCTDSITRFNNVTSAFVALSVAPTLGDNCTFHNNLFVANRSILARWDGDTPRYWTGSAEKRDDWGAGDFSVMNVSFYKNTYFGNNTEAVLRESSWDLTDVLEGVNYTDNLFIGDNTQVMHTTGTEADNNYLGNNGYYEFSNGPIFGAYNSETEVGYYTLAEVQSLSSIWDTNSVYGDPLINSYFIPNSNSPLCGAASDGGDIGAFSCQDTSGPVITVNTPTGATYTSEIFTVSVSTSETADVWYTLDGGVTNTTVYLSSTSGSTENEIVGGEYTISVYAEDTTGNIEVETFAFTFQVDKPSGSGGSGGSSGGSSSQSEDVDDGNVVTVSEFVGNGLTNIEILEPASGLLNKITCQRGSQHPDIPLIVRNPTEGEVVYSFDLDGELECNQIRDMPLAQGETGTVQISGCNCPEFNQWLGSDIIVKEANTDSFAARIPFRLYGSGIQGLALFAMIALVFLTLSALLIFTIIGVGAYSRKVAR